MSTITIVSIVCACIALGINLFINLPLMIWTNKELDKKLGKTKKIKENQVVRRKNESK